MRPKDQTYRVIHNLLENPILLERIAVYYETMTDSATNLSYRRCHLQKIRDKRSIPQAHVMKKICEAYRISNERIQGSPDTRDITVIESELMTPYHPIQ